MKAEYIWFHVIIIILLVLVIALCAANVYYFNQLRQNPTAQVSHTVALTMLILNAVAIGLSLAVLIWAIARLITNTVNCSS